MKHRAVEASLPNNELPREDVDLGTEHSHARVKYGYSDNKLQCWIHIFLAALIGTSLRLTVFPEAVSIYSRVNLQDVACDCVFYLGICVRKCALPNNQHSVDHHDWLNHSLKPTGFKAQFMRNAIAGTCRRIRGRVLQVSDSFPLHIR